MLTLLAPVLEYAFNNREVMLLPSGPNEISLLIELSAEARHKTRQKTVACPVLCTSLVLWCGAPLDEVKKEKLELHGGVFGRRNTNKGNDSLDKSSKKKWVDKPALAREKGSRENNLNVFGSPSTLTCAKILKKPWRNMESSKRAPVCCCQLFTNALFQKLSRVFCACQCARQWYL